MTILHAHAQYIYIVNAKYQKPSVKALVQVDFPVYAQAKSLFKSKLEKNGSFQKAVILSKKTFFLASNFFMQMFNESILCRQSNELFRLRDCSHKNQILLGRIAQTDFFYRDDSPGTIRTNGKKVE